MHENIKNEKAPMQSIEALPFQTIQFTTLIGAPDTNA